MLKLHHARNSRAGSILWLLEGLKLPYELNRMEFHPKALKSDEHRVRHPLGCMPEEMTHLHAYVKRVEARPAFDKAIKT